MRIVLDSSRSDCLRPLVLIPVGWTLFCVCEDDAVKKNLPLGGCAIKSFCVSLFLLLNCELVSSVWSSCFPSLTQFVPSLFIVLPPFSLLVFPARVWRTLFSLLDLFFSRFAVLSVEVLY